MPSSFENALREAQNVVDDLGTSITSEQRRLLCAALGSAWRLRDDMSDSSDDEEEEEEEATTINRTVNHTISITLAQKSHVGAIVTIVLSLTWIVTVFKLAMSL